jgi:hypothetical protein
MLVFARVRLEPTGVAGVVDLPERLGLTGGGVELLVELLTSDRMP